MDFADLSRLWLLLALPLLYWLARPPRPQQRVVTPHMAQWRAAVARTQRRPVRFRRLRFWLLVLAVIALVAASAGPKLAGRPGPRRLVVLLDESTSMRAGTAWREARDALAEAVDAVPEYIDVRVVRCGASVDVVDASDLAVDADLLGGSGSVPPELAQEIAVDGEVAMLTITDGLGPYLRPDVGAIRFVGRPLANRAIVACDVVDGWPGAGIEVRARVRATRAGVPEEYVVELDGVEVSRGRAIDEITFVGERLREGGELAVRLVGEADGFPHDDAVRFTLPASPAPDVAILGDATERPALLAAAETLAHVGGGRVVGPDATKAGFAVTEGGRLESLPPRAILFGTRLGDGGESAASRVAPTLLDWDRASPLLAGIDLSELRIARALPVERMPAGRTLLRGESGPLAVAVERPEGAVTVCFGFRLADSNLALLPALPQVLARAYRAAWGSRARPSGASTNLLSPSESELVASEPRKDRPLPDFGSPDTPLAVPLVLLAMLALALRILA